MRDRFRLIGVAIALVASSLPFWGAPPAGAGSATSFPVLITRAGEFQPAREGSFLAWERNTRHDPNAYHIFARHGSGKPFKVNAPKTQGANGGIDGNILAYQQFRGKSSRILLYDLMQRKRLKPPEGVNSRKWEYWPSISESLLLFGRVARWGERRLILFDLTTGKRELLDQTFAKQAFIQPGQVNGDYVVWSRCTPHMQCEVFRYRISSGKIFKIPNTGRFQRAPSVAADGTVYLVRSGRRCGFRAKLLRFQDGAFEVLVDLPNNADIGDTYAHTDQDGNTEVLYELNACDRPAGSDIWMIEESGSFSLSVSKIGDGSGRVTSEPAGISCGSDCSETYSKGATVELTATPNSGSAFSGWGGACSGADDTCVVTVDAAQEVKAAFDPPDSFMLAVAKTGDGSGTVTSAPSGINCGSDCSGSFPRGSSVKLEADPAGDSSFIEWEGACSGTATTCTVSMNQARSVSAEFSDTEFELEVVRGGDGSGTVTSSPTGISCGTDCSEDYENDEDVTLTATPTESSTFGGWGGDCEGEDTEVCEVEMDGDQSVIAFFEPVRDLDVSVTGETSGEKVTSSPDGIDCPGDCHEPYEYGTNVTLTANPGDGREAVWGGDCSGSDNTCQLDMTADRDVTATFGPITHDLVVEQPFGGDGTGTVTDDDGKISCPSDCEGTYNEDESVTLTATGTSPSTFVEWGGSCAGEATNVCTVTMDGDKNVTATFDDPSVTQEQTTSGAFWISQGGGSSAYPTFEPGVVAGGEGGSLGRPGGKSFAMIRRQAPSISDAVRSKKAWGRPTGSPIPW